MDITKIGAALLISDGLDFSSGQPKGKDDLTSSLNYDYWRNLLRTLFSERILVSSQPLSHLAWKDLIVHGQYSREAPLAAIHTALTLVQNQHLMTIDSKIMGITAETIQKIAGVIEPRWDVVVARSDGRFEYIAMVYHKRCLKIMDRLLAQESYRMDDFLRQVRVYTHTISIDKSN